MSLRIIGADLVYTTSPDASGNTSNIIVISGEQKPCAAFGEIAGGLLAVLRHGTDGAPSVAAETNKRGGRRGDDKKKSGGKTANGTPVSSGAKKTLSVCAFNEEAMSIHFHTHVSVDGWSDLVVSPNSPFVILTDYNTAHSEVLEWQTSSKTLRRVWEGRGCCPHHFNDGEDILLLLYSAKKFSLCSAKKNMKEIDECSARSRDLDIVDVFACNEYAIVAYEGGACSVFEVSDDAVRRVIDLGKVLGGKKISGVTILDDTDELVIYSKESGDVCLLNPMTHNGKNTFEKVIEAKALFKANIEAAESEKRRYTGGGNGDASASAADSDKKGKKEKKSSKKDEKAAAAAQAEAAAAEEEGDDECVAEEGGIGLLPLVGVVFACMAVTVAVAVKVASK